MCQQFVADVTQLGFWIIWALTEHTLMTVYALFVANQLLMAPELSVTGWLVTGARWLARKTRPRHLDW